MKKVVYSCLVVLMCLAATEAQAQFRFGVKGGVNTNFVSADVLEYVFDNNTIGYFIGPSIEYLANGKWGLDASVYYSQKGIQVKGESTHRMGYIEIPVNFKYVFRLSDPIKLFASAGPYVNFKVSGDDSFEVDVDGMEGQWEPRSMGAGLNVGAGVELFRMLQIGATYGLGLSDTFEDAGGLYSARERVWSFSTAVYF